MVLCKEGLRWELPCELCGWGYAGRRGSVERVWTEMGGGDLCVVSVFFALRACVGGGMGCEPFRLRFVMGWDGFRVYGVGE